MNAKEKKEKRLAFKKCMKEVGKGMDEMYGLGPDGNKKYKVDPFVHGMLSALDLVGEAETIEEAEEQLFYDRMTFEVIIPYLDPGSGIEQYYKGRESIRACLEGFLAEEEEDETD